MEMPRFFSPTALAVGGHVDLPESAARHAIRVLRLKAGDALTLFDGRGGQYECRIASHGRDTAAAEVLRWRDTECESPLDLTLIQALQAGEKMDFTVQKAVELGVARILPVVSRRSVVRLDGARASRRVAHWRAVAASACEQCGRNRLPEVLDLVELERWLAAPLAANAEHSAAEGGNTGTTAAASTRLRLMLDPRAPTTLAGLMRPAAAVRIEVLIGAEGGLAPEEETLARQAGFLPVRLGPRVLRTETAGLATLAVIQSLWGDLGEISEEEGGLVHV